MLILVTNSLNVNFVDQVASWIDIYETLVHLNYTSTSI